MKFLLRNSSREGVENTSYHGGGGRGRGGVIIICRRAFSHLSFHSVGLSFYLSVCRSVCRSVCLHVSLCNHLRTHTSRKEETERQSGLTGCCKMDKDEQTTHRQMAIIRFCEKSLRRKDQRVVEGLHTISLT